MCCIMLYPTAEKLVASISKQQTFSAAVTTAGLASRRTLQFCCKVTDTTDASNHVLSPTVVMKVETGEAEGAGVPARLVACAAAVWITEELCDVHAVIGQRAQLTCPGEGAGELSYTWLKASTPNARFSYHKTTKLGVLPFDKLSVGDAGHYQCQVENKWQRVDSKVVQVKPLLPHAVKAAGEGISSSH